MPFTKPLPRYRSIPSAVVGGTVFMSRRLELQPVFLVPDPPALGDQPFPCGHGRQRADDRRLVPASRRFHAQDTEAVLLVVEGDALDQPGDFFGRGSALWDCGVHLVGIHFPTDGLPCVTSQEADSAPNWLPGGVWGGWGVSEAVEGFVTSLAGGSVAWA